MYVYVYYVYVVCIVCPCQNVKIYAASFEVDTVVKVAHDERKSCCAENLKWVMKYQINEDTNEQTHRQVSFCNSFYILKS